MCADRWGADDDLIGLPLHTKPTIHQEREGGVASDRPGSRSTWVAH